MAYPRTKPAFLSAVLLFLIASTLGASSSFDGSRIKWDGRTRVYANIQAEGGVEKGGIYLSRPEAKGPLVMAERRADGSPSPDSAKISLDAQGRVSKLESKDGVHYISYDPEGALASSVTAKGRWTRDVRTTKPVSYAAIAPFIAGSYDLDAIGQGLDISLFLFKEEGIDEYGAYLKVLRKERLVTKAGAFDAIVIELSISGLAGLFVPKIPIWIDAGTRMTLKIGFPKSALELVEVK